MSLKKIHDVQPKNFIFSDKNLKIANDILKNTQQKIKKVQ